MNQNNKREMKLIADSGATKTAWYFVENGEVVDRASSPGISPYYMEESSIAQLLKTHIVSQTDGVREIYYYGTGCDSETNNSKIKRLLQAHFPSAEKIEVNSDLLAAARALCKGEKGIACILGTGSNSCLYDGEKILENRRGYGYIIGDAGSGAALGKLLVIDFLYGKMPPQLKSEMAESFQLSEQKIMDEVYHGEMPSRFLASFARFAHDHRNDGYMAILLHGHFSRFFDLMVLPYFRKGFLSLHFTGSVAFGFQELIAEMAKQHGIQTGLFLKEPMDGLVGYHCGGG